MAQGHFLVMEKGLWRSMRLREVVFEVEKPMRWA